jgi:hypothetical protein
VALLEKRGFLYNHSGDFPQVILIIPSHVPNTKIYECRNWETEHYNYVLEIRVSFLGLHKWEPAIFIGYLPVLQLQWTWRT